MYWLRPSGREIETNNEPATVEKALELGWELLEEDETEDETED